MRPRVQIALILVCTAALLWLGAFGVLNALSQSDAWLAYTFWRPALLLLATAILVIVTAFTVQRYRLLPGRPLSSVLIAIVFLVLFQPQVVISSARRHQLVAKDRFYGVADATQKYIVFAGALIIGCIIASDRK
jgi:arginine exporter protein ArgO